MPTRVERLRLGTRLLSESAACGIARRQRRAARRDAVVCFAIAGYDSLGPNVTNYCFPTTWPTDRERRARYIGEWLKTEARYLAS